MSTTQGPGKQKETNGENEQWLKSTGRKQHQFGAEGKQR